MALKGAQQRTQKGQSVLNLTEDEARAHVEKLLWPNGEPVCRHCGSVNAYRMQGKSCRPGLCRCRDCKKQFTVTVGTIFEDSHLPLSTWVKAIHLMCSSKKGISALQLMRNLGLGSYRTAWFMAHRIRLAMRCEPMAGMLTLNGQVQADETFVGGRKRLRKGEPVQRRMDNKTPVVVMVESREGGRAVAKPVGRVDARTLRAALHTHVNVKAHIVTDEHVAYPSATREFATHQTVNHSIEEYVKPGFDIYGDAAPVTTNTAESFFALLKRGVHGTFHHVSRQHLGRYCDEFSFRWNARTLSDSERRTLAIGQVEGKRLMLKTPTGRA